MFCPKCGNEIAEGTVFCGKCGEKTTENVTNIAADNIAPSISSDKKSGGLFLPKIFAIIALICFFFPFMTVSCGGLSYELSGKDMIFGDSEISEELESRASENDSDGGSIFNWFVCIAGALGTLSLFARKNNALGGAISSFLAFVFLLIFRFSAKFYYKIGDTRLSEFRGEVLQVDFGAALYFSMILFVIASVVFLALTKEDEIKEFKKDMKST